MISIVQAEAKHLPDFIRLAERFFYESDNCQGATWCAEAYSQIFLSAVKDSTVSVLMAYWGEDLLGYCIITYFQHFTKERIGDMYQLYVAPEARGTNVARLLAEATVDQFDAWGCVISYNYAAPGLAEEKKNLALFRNLWHRYGYRQSGIIMVRGV
jgi:GNAT superfamily N-acetyltransferase